MSAPGATEFTVPDPIDDDIVWRVRYYHESRRNWWMKMKRNSQGQFIPFEGAVPAIDAEPLYEEGEEEI